MPPLILVVDDEPVIRYILAEILTDEGYRVRCAEDGRQALDQVAVEVPDLIVSDIRMPRVHGVEFVERLRAQGHATPVVLISTWAPPPNLPGVRFVRKPFDLDDITEAVADGLSDG